MAYLSWIDDENLISAVEGLIKVARKAQKLAEATFNKNVIDPFSAIFQIAGFDISYKEWILTERARQSQKSLQNHIGNFHQSILGHVEGWENLGIGSVMDLVCTQRKILAEIKNKHNTVKGSDLAGLYKSLENAVMTKSSIYKGFIAYYVTVIPKRPERFDRIFVPSDKEKGMRLAQNEMIRIIDGASFYEIVTGEEDALRQLFDTLPRVIGDGISFNISEHDFEILKQMFTSAYGK